MRLWVICPEIGLLTYGWLSLVRRKDPDYRIRMNQKVMIHMIMYCVAAGIWIECCLSDWGWNGQLACGCLAAYLLAASIQDIQCFEVYDVLHILALPPGIVWLVGAEPEKLFSLLLFALLQFGIFMRMYGAGDGYAFCVCAVYECRFGNGMITYLLHMASVFLMLAIVQGWKRNIARSGNLRRAVPLMPYIAATVWLFL